MRAAAAGVGNAVVLMGASTGRDGIGGASVLASAELGEGDEAKRPTVQIGDPFEESKVLECCLELLAKGLLVSLQDLGAAGLTSSAGEMASAGGVGIDIDVARVPLREADMEPFEIMVSESQERMLAVVEPARVAEVLAVCEKWQTGVGGDRRRHRQRPGAGAARRARSSARCRSRRWSTAARSTTSSRPSRRAGSTATGRRSRPGASAEETLLALLASPSIASKRWAFEQYDSVVGSRTVRRPESADAAVLQIPEAGNAIAVSIDGNGRRVACDPYAGTVEAVLECAQNLACVGAEPLGLTNCLNFGNPEKPAPAWQLDRAVSGLADACRRSASRSSAATSPSTTRGRKARSTRPRWSAWSASCPTRRGSPAAPSPARATRSPCSAPSPPPLAGSELAKQRGELDTGLPQPDIAAVAAACAAVRDAVRAGKLASAHDVSDGGLACALAESAIGAGLGCRVDLQHLRERGCSPEEALFGEGSGGFLRQRRARRRSEALGARLPRRGRRRRRSRSPPATAASSSASATPRAPGVARCRRRPSTAAPDASAAKTAKR